MSLVKIGVESEKRDWLQFVQQGHDLEILDSIATDFLANFAEPQSPTRHDMALAPRNVFIKQIQSATISGSSAGTDS